MRAARDAIAVIENDRGLARYFEPFLKGLSVPYEIFPVYRSGEFPKTPYNGYIFTGDTSNISDGLKPYHEKELEFLGQVRGGKIFASCFSHQLLAHRHGGAIRRRERRSFGWKAITLCDAHPVFEGVESPFFLCLNGDEVCEAPAAARLLAVGSDCRFQMCAYGQNILTCQSHPEMLLDEALTLIDDFGEGLRDRCEDLDEIVAATKGLARDAVNRRFLENVVRWLMA